MTRPLSISPLGTAPRSGRGAQGQRPARPQDSRLIDGFGRIATDLRVSLTDRCNLRCTYCMPAEGLDWMADERLLSDDELIRLITVAVTRLGVEEVRFTGGEPLLRKGLERILAATTALRTASGGVPQTALTTNGLGLERRADALVAAGLHRINVSLDTLDRARFIRIAHRDRLDDVLAGLQAAADAGLAPVKVNTVLLRGVNEDEAAGLLGWAVGQGYELRFIEQMPLDAQGSWERTEMITAAEILDALRREFTLVPTGAAARGAAPAETWIVDGEAGRTPSGDQARVGIVASVTRPFCGDCDRTRLTADGQVRTCLFSRTETDLRALLRNGADDEQVAQAWRTAMWGKLAGHDIDDPSFLQPDRPMSAIGG
ncbi:MAG: GTP 3',8-cyclase MoaA [Kineosporiaceae bacterium]|nr:GTP 3',8-cyclase MoaA [Kineosporiaceae bacterium]MBK7623122.1 GTP 3',8-cyclase MoaA [Kineosporiaceae bacterium]MBK8074927.1 GTP 3',8-cyclase MoaA [Kineosporiaceae bacterium]